jgi:hypothetical protein
VCISATTLELYPSMYAFGRTPLNKRGGIVRLICTKRCTASVWPIWILAVTLVVSSGVAYRFLSHRLRLVVDTPVALPVELMDFPRQIGPWVGKDVPIPPNIQRIAGTDASLKRLYVNETSDEQLYLYIAYTAHPRTMLGHRPRICYVAGGWVHDSTQAATITSEAGREVPCLIHRFHRPAPSSEEIIVLNFYIVDGLLTSDDSVFSGVGWRTPNINGNPARYVTQVQISSVLENTIRTAAREMVEPILDFFPDETGRVRAVDYVNRSGDPMK